MGIAYTDRVFRPPAEAGSLILQLAIGCPHNTCRFCAMYKGIAYRERDSDDCRNYVRAAAADVPDASRLFLADGDIMHLPFERLRDILRECNRAFPALARVTCYANGSSLAARTAEQLRELRRLKLAIVYVGLETGDDALLRRVGKREDVQTMVAGVTLAQAAGIRASVMVLLGLGGQTGSATHVAASAAALNRMQPRLLSALRLVEVPGVRMFEGYHPLTEYESVCELRSLVASLEMERTVFAANHVSIPFPVQGRLPHDRALLLAGLDRVLVSARLDRRGSGRTPLWL